MAADGIIARAVEPPFLSVTLTHVVSFYSDLIPGIWGTQACYGVINSYPATLILNSYSSEHQKKTQNFYSLA